MRQIAPGVYIENKYDSGNVGLIATGAGTVCIDVPMMPRDAQDWRSRIQRVTNEPIVLLIQTDYDLGRILSTDLFSVPLIAHAATWEQMTKIYARERAVRQIQGMLNHTGLGQDWQVRMPDVTFTDRVLLNKGNKEIHVLHAGGHSPATCMVHLPQDRLIFTGDTVFNNAHPTMEYAETKAWLQALNRLRKMTVDTIVPGHGAVCDREATYPLSEYIREMRAKVRISFQARRSKSETSKIVIPEFVDAFPYPPGDADRVRRYVKDGSDRIYDEYRAARATRARSGKRRKPRRARQGRASPSLSHAKRPPPSTDALPTDPDAASPGSGADLTKHECCIGS